MTSLHRQGVEVPDGPRSHHARRLPSATHAAATPQGLQAEQAQLDADRRSILDERRRMSDEQERLASERATLGALREQLQALQVRQAEGEHGNPAHGHTGPDVDYAAWQVAHGHIAFPCVCSHGPQGRVDAGADEQQRQRAELGRAAEEASRHEAELRAAEGR